MYFRVLHNCFWTNLKDAALSCFLFLHLFFLMGKVWGDHQIGRILHHYLDCRVWHLHCATLIAVDALLFFFFLALSIIEYLVSFPSAHQLTTHVFILLPAVMDKDVYPQHSWLIQVQQRSDNSWVCQGYLEHQTCHPPLERCGYYQAISGSISGNPRGSRSNWSEHLPQPPSRKRCSPQFCVVKRRQDEAWTNAGKMRHG